MEYAHKKIDHNFSNYSAWHSRTVLLPVAHGEPQQQGTGSEIAGLLAGGLASGAIAAAAGGAPAGVDPEQVSAERQQAEPSVRESQKAGGAAGQEGSSSSSAGGPWVLHWVMVTDVHLRKTVTWVCQGGRGKLSGCGSSVSSSLPRGYNPLPAPLVCSGCAHVDKTAC